MHQSLALGFLPALSLLAINTSMVTSSCPSCHYAMNIGQAQCPECGTRVVWCARLDQELLFKPLWFALLLFSVALLSLTGMALRICIGYLIYNEHSMSHTLVGIVICLFILSILTFTYLYWRITESVRYRSTVFLTMCLVFVGCADGLVRVMFLIG